MLRFIDLEYDEAFLEEEMAQSPYKELPKDQLDRLKRPGTPPPANFREKYGIPAAPVQKAGSTTGQRNSSGPKAIDARGPHQPVKWDKFGGKDVLVPSGPALDPWKKVKSNLQISHPT